MVLKRAKFQWCQIGDFIDDITLFSRINLRMLVD